MLVQKWTLHESDKETFNGMYAVETDRFSDTLVDGFLNNEFLEIMSCPLTCFSLPK